MHIRHSPLSRSGRLVLCIWLVIVWCGAPNVVVAQRTRAPSASTAPSAEDRKRAVADMERAFAALEVAVKDIPRDTFKQIEVLQSSIRASDINVAAKAAELGPNVAAAGFSGNLSATTTHGISQRSPEMRAEASALALPVSRTLDLAHVDPLHVAAALASDPVRIFEYVRDNVAFEAYTGVLRGPRGTLLAMAANGADRALLLGRLLEYAGRRVRYVRGTLSESLATDLVMSMWASRERRANQRTALPPDGSPMLDRLVGSISLNYALIREQLRKVKISPEAAATPHTQLVREAMIHYWVQVAQGGGWKDFDPLLSDSVPGATYTKAEQFLPSLPNELFHQLSVRLRIEEQGEAGATNREILTYSVPAPLLAGRDLILLHLPEDWSRPTDAPSSQPFSPPGTTAVKPVFFVGKEIVQGKSFRQVAEPSLGTRIGSMLGRRSSTVGAATAEWLDLEVIGPDGRREVITREIFDLIGPAERAHSSARPGQPTSISPARFVDIRGSIHDVLVTTGRIESSHLPVAEEIQGADTPPTEDVTGTLRSINIAAVVTADRLAGGLRAFNGATVLFYPDSPRFHIVELSGEKDTVRISLDLRRHRMRAVAMGGNDSDVFFAQIFRGVVGGVLERVLTEQLLDTTNSATQPSLSTAAVLDRAQSEKVPIIVLPEESARLDSTIPEDARVRLERDSRHGLVTVVPARPISIRKTLRLAWWRIDPRSGETTGVTDEGLHQGATERKGVEFHISKSVTGGWWVHVTQSGYGFARPFTLAWGDTLGIRALAKVIWILLRGGARFRGFGNFPYIPI